MNKNTFQSMRKAKKTTFTYNGRTVAFKGAIKNLGWKKARELEERLAARCTIVEHEGNVLDVYAENGVIKWGEIKKEFVL